MEISYIRRLKNFDGYKFLSVKSFRRLKVFVGYKVRHFRKNFVTFYRRIFNREGIYCLNIIFYDNIVHLMADTSFGIKSVDSLI